MGFIRVVNMIPSSLSGEANQDSEPNIAVNPERPTDMVATAFTPAPAGGGLAPIYVSTDGGETWSLRNVVPGGPTTGDITVGFATTGGLLYAGILNGQSAGRMQILRTSTFTGNTPMTVLVDRNLEDQPWVVAGSVVINGRSVDRVYVGSRDAQPRPSIGAVAAVDVSLDAATAPAPAGFRETALGLRRGRFGLPPTRIAIHADGTVYAVFLHVTRTFGDGNNMDFEVIVRRDDNWGDNVAAFSDLTEGNNSLGVRAGIGFCRFNDIIGQERVGADLAIAVDPNDSSIVYVAFCARTGGAAGTDWQLNVIRSNDRGNGWSLVRDIGPIAKNPALAINAEGRVGLAYQQFTGSQWVTRLELTRNGFATPPETHVLHQAPSNIPVRRFVPYIGDYIRLLAVRKDFYGVFSGNNAPVPANFPSGISYQRFANFATGVLLNTNGITPVATSIDPFFFHWSLVKLFEGKEVVEKPFLADVPPKKSDSKEVVEKPFIFDLKSTQGETKGIFENKGILDQSPRGVGRTGPEDFASMFLKLRQRIEVLEAQVAQGRAFIRPAERPEVGTPDKNADDDE
jgi:hypothetical protein